jgi:hypothetical protein
MISDQANHLISKLFHSELYRIIDIIDVSSSDDVHLASCLEQVQTTSPLSVECRAHYPARGPETVSKFGGKETGTQIFNTQTEFFRFIRS